MNVPETGAPIAPQVPTITAEQAHEEIETENPIIVDVRPQEYFIQGHIKGARNIPLSSFADRALQDLPDKNARILVYCFMGHLSASAVEYLIRQGYTHVASMGGIQGWPYGVER